MPKFAADFETTTDADDCRVWAWAVCDVTENPSPAFGNDMQSFIKWCKANTGSKVYFHNLKFDGKFILDWALKHGYKHMVGRDMEPMTVSTLISDMGQWYSMKLCFGNGEMVEFIDSLKIIPLPISAMPKAFGIPEQKLELDYRAKREIGHVLTCEERDYIAHDVVIAAKALHQMFDWGMKKMTAGSNAFSDYKKVIGGNRRFRDWYPLPEYDGLIRSGGCYKGGFVSANSKFAGRIVGKGCSFDVNSLYPSVMASAHGEKLPYGEPAWFDGEYRHDPLYPLHISFVEVDFTVKPNHIPCLQLKGNSRFQSTEYVRDTKGSVSVCLTSVDLGMLFAQYDVRSIVYKGGLKFKASDNLFRAYVEKWTAVKTQATLDGNEGLRTIAKLQLNSLYGKMATNPRKRSKIPYLDDFGVVRYVDGDEEETEPQYLPVGAFVTAWARKFTVSAAQANYDRWLYCDTDSCYLLGRDDPDGMAVDAVELGAWKREHDFDRFKVLRAKTYCFEESGKLTVHCAGMPSRCHGSVTMENFDFGASYAGKLVPRNVEGGIILVDDVFTINQ